MHSLPITRSCVRLTETIRSSFSCCCCCWTHLFLHLVLLSQFSVDFVGKNVLSFLEFLQKHELFKERHLSAIENRCEISDGSSKFIVSWCSLWLRWYSLCPQGIVALQCIQHIHSCACFPKPHLRSAHLSATSRFLFSCLKVRRSASNFSNVEVILSTNTSCSYCNLRGKQKKELRRCLIVCCAVLMGWNQKRKNLKRLDNSDSNSNSNRNNNSSNSRKNGSNKNSSNSSNNNLQQQQQQQQQQHKAILSLRWLVTVLQEQLKSWWEGIGLAKSNNSFSIWSGWAAGPDMKQWNTTSISIQNGASVFISQLTGLSE